MDNIKKSLGKKIRTLRRLKGFSQEELGEKAKLSYKFLGEIERGEANPSLQSLMGIADALGVTVGDLLPKQSDIIHQFSPNDVLLIKKALKLLNKAFSKMQSQKNIAE
jgi:transcriptional regulator with XRE-family HTH domain